MCKNVTMHGNNNKASSKTDAMEGYRNLGYWIIHLYDKGFAVE